MIHNMQADLLIMADEAAILHDDAAQHKHNGKHGDILVAETINPHAGRKLKPPSAPTPTEMAVSVPL